MAKLVIDDGALALAARRLGGQPVFAEADGSLLAPGVLDVLAGDAENIHRWQPGNEATRHLLLAGEACRDITDIAGRYGAGAERRVLKQLTVPLCSLMDRITSLQALLNTDEHQAQRRAWPRSDQELYRTYGRNLRKRHKHGAVRQVRNKLAAHLDVEAFASIQPKITAEEILPELDEGIVLSVLVARHEHAFCWIRPVAATQEPGVHLVETFFDYPLCVRWLTDPDGKVLDVSRVQLAADPRHAVRDQAVAAAAAYNLLVDRSGCRRRHIIFHDTADLLARESEDSPSSGSQG